MRTSARILVLTAVMVFAACDGCTTPGTDEPDAGPAASSSGGASSSVAGASSSAGSGSSSPAVTSSLTGASSGAANGSSTAAASSSSVASSSAASSSAAASSSGGPDAGVPDGGAPDAGNCTVDGWCVESPGPSSAIPPAARLRGIFAHGPDNLTVVGDDGLIARSSGDGTWTLSASGTTHNLFRVWGAAPDAIWAVGGQGQPETPNGIILRFDGNAWTTVRSDAPGTLRAVWGASATDIWAGGWSVLMHYDGVSWTVHEDSPGWDISDIWGLSANDVWAVGSSGNTMHFDGSGWTPVPSGELSGLTSVSGTAFDIYALGGNGILLRLEEGAWANQGSYGNETYFSLYATSARGAYAVGTGGVIQRWTGQAIPEESGTTELLTDVTGINDVNAWAVGWGGTVLRRRP